MKPFLSLLTTLSLSAALASQVGVVTIEPAGESCGPQLVVTMTPRGQGGNHELRLEATGLQPRTMGAMNFGSNPLNVPLPGGCLLLCDSIWSIKFQTDQFGAISWSRAWPNNFYGYFYFQMGSLQVNPNNTAYEAKTTNCVKVTRSMM